jgi:hypothetical protein
VRRKPGAQVAHPGQHIYGRRPSSTTPRPGQGRRKVLHVLTPTNVAPNDTVKLAQIKQTPAPGARNQL